MLESQIKNLSIAGMVALYEDVTYRIGTHVAGGNADPEYVRKQEAILDAIQEEFLRRK